MHCARVAAPQKGYYALCAQLCWTPRHVIGCTAQATCGPMRSLNFRFAHAGCSGPEQFILHCGCSNSLDIADLMPKIGQTCMCIQALLDSSVHLMTYASNLIFAFYFALLPRLCTPLKIIYFLIAHFYSILRNSSVVPSCNLFN